ncbi:hypothetical protein NAT51_15235 [Flavobacterium amniphilum]|uniref:hypothetical protein n=1 Tax=Flavobacterium amniphilum TaxID=1834035 RepID=UPI002029D2E8|nr:hypothetical protein [Flavobacterium amniphilum]MCL9806888.1 hypothetical protein [Flavobacterium amniphilum]
MKQTTFLILLFLFCFIKLYSQEIDSTNVYYKALKTHLSDKEEFYSNNPKLKRPEVFYVEKNEYTTNQIPNIISGKTIKIVTQEDLFTLFKTQKLVSIIAIRPASWKNGSLRINVIDFFVIRNGKKLEYTNTGGSEFEINNFTFKKSERLHGSYD